MADLIDRDALLKAMGLTDAVKYGNKDAEQQYRSYSTWMSYEIADLINDAPAVNRWIPCSERLPEDNQQCLIYRDIKVSNLKMTTGVYFADRQVFIGLRHGTALRDAIAWMPLPEPPESEVHDDDE